MATPDGSVCKLEYGLVDDLVREGTDERGADVPLVAALAAEHLRDAVLLDQKRLLVHLLEQAVFASPRAERLEVLHSLLLRPNVAHLDYDERVLVRWAGSKKHVCVKLARCPLDTIAEMPQKRGCRSAVEAASHEKPSEVSQKISEIDGKEDALDQVACEYDGHRVRACFVAGRNAERRTSTAQTPPEI